ncbi:hypothetical protein [Streptomyces sp. NPDC093808]|uniref:hypothetical protein n=1 Tax=Streptomyces sp. NPDC093808 TaxID=3154985 RepID=UPI00344C7B0E
MSGRPDSDVPPDTRTAPDTAGEETEAAEAAEAGAAEDAHEGDDEEFLAERARRARRAAVGTGAVLAAAGTAAALLRAVGTAPALVPVAYACGAAVCALGAVLGARGRTRRALWTAVAGVMVMALGDQFD